MTTKQWRRLYAVIAVISILLAGFNAYAIAVGDGLADAFGTIGVVAFMLVGVVAGNAALTAEAPEASGGAE